MVIVGPTAYFSFICLYQCQQKLSNFNLVTRCLCITDYCQSDSTNTDIYTVGLNLCHRGICTVLSNVDRFSFCYFANLTLIAWGFAFLYSICQLVVPQSFQNPNHVADYQSWLDLLFISFSLQSATGLSDLIPVAPAARVISMLQMFCGVMYFALIVSRMIALQYIENKPKS